MHSVNVAELKNRLSKYLRFAKGGEEIIIRDRNLPVAKLVPFVAEEPTLITGTPVITVKASVTDICILTEVTILTTAGIWTRTT